MPVPYVRYLPGIAPELPGIVTQLQALPLSVLVATPGTAWPRRGGTPLSRTPVPGVYASYDAQQTRPGLPELGQVMVVTGTVQGARTWPLGTGALVLTEHAPHAAELCAALRAVGWVAEPVSTEDLSLNAGPRTAALRALPPSLVAELPALTAAEAPVRRRWALSRGLLPALQAAADAATPGEAADLARRVVATHHLTQTAVVQLFTHADREVRLAALRSRPALQAAVAETTAAAAADWRVPLRAALGGAMDPPRELVAEWELQRALGVPYAVSMIQLLHGREHTATSAHVRLVYDAVRRPLLASTAPTALDAMDELACHFATLAPERLHPDHIFQGRTPDSGLHPLGMAPGQLLNLAYTMQPVLQGAGCRADIPGVASAVLTRSVQDLHLSMLGLVAAARLGWREAGSTPSQVALEAPDRLRQRGAAWAQAQAAPRADRAAGRATR